MCNIGELLKNCTKTNSSLQPFVESIAANSVQFRNVAIEDCIVTLERTESFLTNYDALKLKLDDLSKEKTPRPNEIKRVKQAMDENWDQFEQLLSVSRIKKDFIESKKIDLLSHGKC